MHIAICDDHVADRKQLERLLERESDARLKNKENFYISSFGNITSLMHTPELYDIFFIDMTTDSINGIALAVLLRNHNIQVPIVLCSSSIHYKDYPCTLNSIIYLDKPIKTADITSIITNIWELKKTADPIFEIRGYQKTFYIKAEDFLFAEKVSDRQTIVHFIDGTSTVLPDSLQNLEFVLQKHPSLIALNKNRLINRIYIKKISFTSIQLTSGNPLPLGFGEYFDVKKILKASGQRSLWKNV